MTSCSSRARVPFDPTTGESWSSGKLSFASSAYSRILKAIAEGAGASLAHAVKLNVYLTDLTHFPVVNQVMARYSRSPTRRVPR